MNKKGEMHIRARTAFLALAEIVIVAGSMLLAFMIRFDWSLSPELSSACVRFVSYAAVIRVSMSFLFGTYSGSFRYAGIVEALQLFKAATFGTLALATAAFFTQSAYIGRSVLLIDYFFYLFLAGMFRFSVRMALEFKESLRPDLKNVLVIGAGSGGEAVVRNMRYAKKRSYRAVGFIDDDPAKLNRRIHGVKVQGDIESIERVAKRLNAEEIIIAIPSADGKTVRRIVSRSERTGLDIKISAPESGRDSYMRGRGGGVREVFIEDLLGREAVESEAGDIFALLSGKKVLVTGAGGSIGAELCRQITEFSPEEIILLDIDENSTYFLELELKKVPGVRLRTVIGDVSDPGLLDATFKKYAPEVVFHSAAHKHVPLMETNPASAVKNNILATRRIVHASERHGADKFVLISTDKAVNPSNIMGASKRIAEMIIQERTGKSRTKFMAVRFGNVMGSSGSVIPIFKRQIAQGGPVTVTHRDIKRFFMTASEAARLVLQAGAIGSGGEIFVLNMGEQIKIYDLARNLITLSGLETEKDIEIKFIGLRPGEKMQEEMFLAEEHDEATESDNIFITRLCDGVPETLDEDIAELESFAREMDEEKIVFKIKEMVPAYKARGK